VDNWAFPRLPESVARGTFQSSRRGLALPRQRPKGRRRRRDFGTGSTRRRDAARWRDAKRNAPRFVLVPTKSRPLRPRRRNVGKVGFSDRVPRDSKASGQSWTVRGPGRKDRSRNRRAAGTGPRDHTPLPDGTGTGASAGRWKRRFTTSSQERCWETVLKTPGDKRPLRDPPPVRVGSAARLAPFLLGPPRQPTRRPQPFRPCHGALASARRLARATNRAGCPTAVPN